VTRTGDLARPGGWGIRIEAHSESSSRIYIVSEKLRDGQPTGTYGCSCPGWKAYRGECKHLRNMHLKSCEPRITPRRRGQGVSDNTAFTDTAYEHYDVTVAGYGSASQWFALAEELARGRKTYVPPPRVSPSMASDMKLLGLTAMPADVKDLLRAMYRESRKLHPDFVHPTDPAHRINFPQCPECDAAATAFTAVQMAYERLVKRYPK
jgi:hypothetical protein